MRRTAGNIVLNVLFGTVIIGGILATLVSTSVREARTAQAVAVSTDAQTRARNTLKGAENTLYSGVRAVLQNSLDSSANYDAPYYFQVGNLPAGTNNGMGLPTWGADSVPPGSEVGTPTTSGGATPIGTTFNSGTGTPGTTNGTTSIIPGTTTFSNDTSSGMYNTMSVGPDSTPAESTSHRLQTSVDSFMCRTSTAARLYVTGTACGVALPDGVTLPSPYFLSGTTSTPGRPAVQSYAFPFVLIGQADIPAETGSAQLLKMSGEFRVTLGSPSLTHWALAANSLQGVSGTNQFLDTSVLLTGPVHVNVALAFQGKPYLNGVVSSSSCGYVAADVCAPGQARLILPRGEKTPNALLPSPGKPCDASACPSLMSGNIDYHAAPVLPTSNSLQTAAGTNGLLFSQSAQRVLLHAGTDDSGTEYQYLDVALQDGSDYTYRISSQGLMQQSPDNGATWIAPRLFNGVVYVQGSIAVLSSRDGDGDTAVARFAPLSIAADNDINVTSSLTYTVPPCAELPRVESGTLINPSCQNTTAVNVLGVYSHEGDIVLGTDDTSNMTVDAALMSRVGTVRPARTSGGQYINLLGSLFEGRYTPMSYYDRGSSYALRFGFDPRFSEEIGYAPPAWPTTAANQVLTINVQISKAVRVDNVLPSGEIMPASEAASGASGPRPGTRTPVGSGTPVSSGTSGVTPSGGTGTDYSQYQ